MASSVARSDSAGFNNPSFILAAFPTGSILAFDMVFEQNNYSQQVLRLGDLAENNNTMENVMSWNSYPGFIE